MMLVARQRPRAWLCGVVLCGMVGGADAAADVGPQQMVVTTTERMLDALHIEAEEIKHAREHLDQLVEEIVAPNVDFAGMSRWALGRYWRSASAEQRQQFQREFRTLVLRTYATALLVNQDNSIEFLPTREQSDDKSRMTVRSEIKQRGGPDVPMNYSVHRVGDRWYVYDLTIDGISLLTNYRSSFSSQIKRMGLAAFLETLAERNRAGLLDEASALPGVSTGQ